MVRKGESGDGKRTPPAGDNHADHRPADDGGGFGGQGLNTTGKAFQLKAVAPHPSSAVKTPKPAACPISTTSAAHSDGSGSSRRGPPPHREPRPAAGHVLQHPRVWHLEQSSIDRLLGIGHRRHREQPHRRYPRTTPPRHEQHWPSDFMDCRPLVSGHACLQPLGFQALRQRYHHYALDGKRGDASAAPAHQGPGVPARNRPERKPAFGRGHR